METDIANDTRIRARDAATRMLNRLSAGVGIGAITGVAVLGAVSAYTIPGIVTYNPRRHRQHFNLDWILFVQPSVILNPSELLIELRRHSLRRILALTR